jgi:hypothetical protein
MYRVARAVYCEVCRTSFQGGRELMDVKVEEVIDVKEEEEDPLAVASGSEQEVSCVSVYKL